MTVCQEREADSEILSLVQGLWKGMTLVQISNVPGPKKESTLEGDKHPCLFSTDQEQPYVSSQR